MAFILESLARNLAILSAFIFISAHFTDASVLSRRKRNVVQMCQMIHYYTHNSCWDLNNYGCFCGLGNAGGKPVDGVDACCREHDRCYGEVHCYFWWPQFVGYDVECKSNRCACKDTDSCQRSTCRCDLAFARCMARATYHPGFKGYDRSQCSRDYY